MNVTEASKIVGVPRSQLLRWAGHRHIGWVSGPEYTGHYRDPEYAKADLDAWLSFHKNSISVENRIAHKG